MLKDIRNIGIIAHIDAGKTTTTERVLYYTGKLYRMGEVDEGSATMDYLEEERRRGITITSAATTCYWKGKRINIIDTPGHVDFTAEVERALRILDGGIVIFSAVEGVESQSETVWYQADKYRIPRIVFMNKLDRIGADPWYACKMMGERLGVRPLPVQIPIGIESSFRGVIDLIEMRSLLWPSGTDGLKYTEMEIGDKDKKRAIKAREELLENLSDFDDEIADKFVHEREITPDEIKRAVRETTLRVELFPVLFGASLKNIGVQPLLNAVCDYLPSPVDTPPITGKSPSTGREERIFARELAPFTGLVFKIVNDPYGKLSFIRIYSGKLLQKDIVFDPISGKRERISHIFLIHASKRQEVKIVGPGEICLIQGPNSLKTGHTVCSVQHPIVLESLKFPPPVLSMSIEPKTKSDEDKIATVLKKLEEEDPTFNVKFVKETGEIIISGMGELHLEVLVNRMREEFSLQANVGRPRVTYKETIRKETSSEGKYIKQTGGRGQYGDVKLHIKPTTRGKGIIIKDEIKNGEIPKEFIRSIKEGINEALNSGVLLGFPVTDIEITIRGGSYHPVDSSEIAFKIASSIALQNGLRDGAPYLLEPSMRLEVIVPRDYVGEILDDIGTRGGKILGMESKGISQVIWALCPLRALFGYATALRSLSQGRAVHIMQFESYREVPPQVIEKIIKK
jgi:elongation factor G